MPFAIQILDTTRPRALRRWRTVHTAKRLTVAERVLQSVRQDRLHVATRSRIRPFNGDLSRAYHLAEG